MSFLPPSDSSTAAASGSQSSARPRARVNLAKATRRARKANNDNENDNDATANKRKRASSDEEAEEVEEEEEEDEEDLSDAKHPTSSSNNQITLSGTSHSTSMAPSAAANGIAANRKKKLSGLFPKSKIKALMYEDEEVSKMSAVVPLMVSRCVEHFIADLMASVETQAKKDRDNADPSINFQGKRTLISAQQLKRVILSNPKYDFLVDIANGVSDTRSSGNTPAAAAASKQQKPVQKKQRVEDESDEDSDEQEDLSHPNDTGANVAPNTVIASISASTASSSAISHAAAASEPNIIESDLAGF